MRARLVHDPSEDYRLAGPGLDPARERHHSLHVQVVTHAFTVLEADTFVAYSQKCTHLSCAVYYAPAAHRLECPCHKGYFAVEDGSVLQGPPPWPLPRVVLERRVDDLVATGIEILPRRPAHASNTMCRRLRSGSRA